MIAYQTRAIKESPLERARKLVIGHELGHFVLQPEGAFFIEQLGPAI